jgi:CBS domain containing-hemolysin-like protein
LGAAFAGASWAIGLLSQARRTALREASQGRTRRALDRYLESGHSIEARWLVLRAMAVGLTALLLAREFNGWFGALTIPVCGLLAAIGYAIPSEILRAAVARDAERAAPLMLEVLRPVELLAAPLSEPILWIGRVASRWLTPAPARAAHVTESEVEFIVAEGEMSGSLDHEQSTMIRNVLDFGDVTAEEVMLPRIQVTSLAVDTPLDEALRQVAESGHSRYPVYKGSVDNVIGLLYAKDLLKTAATGSLRDTSLETVLRTPVAFVPESQSASSVLQDMRAGRHHMAIVIDEFGGMSGIVTLEDLLEKIVGDIRDEHDSESPPIADLGDGRLLVDASVPIGDLGRYLGADLPEDGDYRSLGGYIIAELGRVPEVGARVNALGLEFEVREADERKVAKVEIRRSSPPESLAPRSARSSAA